MLQSIAETHPYNLFQAFVVNVALFQASVVRIIECTPSATVLVLATNVVKDQILRNVL